MINENMILKNKFERQQVKPYNKEGNLHYSEWFHKRDLWSSRPQLDFCQDKKDKRKLQFISHV